MKLLPVFALLLFLPVSETFAQSGSWTVKAHAYSSRQRMTNVISTFTLADTSIVGPYTGSGDGGGFGRATFGLMVLHDYAMTSRVAIQAGLGYRQKGFTSVSRYVQNTGYTVPLPARTYQDNLFHYASSELSLQLRTKPNKTIGYARLGQRLDYLLDFRSAFWGDNYAYLSRFDYNVFFSVGIERTLKRKIHLSKKPSTDLYSRPSAFFLEIEATPRLFNIHKTPALTEPFVQVTDRNGNPLLPFNFRMQKIVRNTGFGVVVGVRF